MTIFSFRHLTAILIASAALQPAHAAWPDDKPIEIVVGYAAGGETDTLARTIAPYMRKHLGGKANVVVVNRPGASGEIANAHVQRAAPDGYTVAVVNTPPMVFVPMYKQTQYDPDAFTLIGRAVSDPTLLAVRQDSPYKNLKQLVEALKAKPRTISAGQNGVGTNGNVAMNQLQLDADVQFNDIPFSGTSPSKAALLGGHIDVMFASLTALPAPDKEAVPLRVLTQFMDERAKGLPDVPTAKEEGYAVSVPSDRGFAVSKNVPADIKNRLHEALAAALKDPEFLKAASSFEAVISYLPGDQWQKDLDRSRPIWERLAKDVKAVQ